MKKYFIQYSYELSFDNYTRAMPTLTGSSIFDLDNFDEREIKQLILTHQQSKYGDDKKFTVYPYTIQILNMNKL